jgi:hypothetical protein
MPKLTHEVSSDPIDANAVATVFGRNAWKENPVYLGSIKSNIGYVTSIKLLDSSCTGPSLLTPDCDYSHL